jgi:precorrin-6x reductase
VHSPDEHGPKWRRAASAHEADQIVKGPAGRVGVTVGRRPLGDEAADGWILKCRL